MSEQATIRAKQSIRFGLILAGIQLGGALLLVLAQRLGWIDSDITTRGVMILIGLCLAVYGNAMPKSNEGPPPQTTGEIAVRQSIMRLGGWVMTIGGLVWAALWTFAPRDWAVVGGIAAVLAATLVMVFYAVLRYRAYRSSAS